LKNGNGLHVRTRKLALAEGVTAGVLFGTAAIFIRFVQNLDTFSIVFWRLIIACLTLAAVLVLLKKTFSFNLVRKNIMGLLALSLFLGLHFIFFISAVKDTTILNATVLVNTSPIFTMIVSVFLLKIRPSRFSLAGLMISFIGICLIAYAETVTTTANNFSPSLKGDLEAILAAMVESFYLNYGKKIRSQMTILSIMLPIYLLTAIIVGALGVAITNKTLTISSDTAIILPLLGLGILPTAVAHTLYFSSLSNLKSFETATMALLEPVGATILGVIFFNEVPAYLFILGAALVLFGIFFVVRQKD
jgi:drug/metabolite transporter (DMT)-like permease